MVASARVAPKLLTDAFHAPGTRAHRVVQALVAGLVGVALAILGVELVFAEAIDRWGIRRALDVADRVVLLLFAVEIALRVWTFRPPRLDLYQRGRAWRLAEHVRGRLRFLLRPGPLVDLLTVLALVPALRVLRALRLFQLLRGLSVFERSRTFETLGRSFAESAVVFEVLFAGLGLVVVMGGVTLTFAERGVNPAVASVADGLWWALVTLTTVGYGDVVPQTGIGRAVGGAVMVAGMFSLAMFAGVVGSTLLSAILKIRREHFRMGSDVGHIVLCGYFDGAPLLLEQLRREFEARPGSAGAGDRTVVVLAPRPRPRDAPDWVTWIEGDPTREADLALARVEEAAVAVLVGDRRKTPQEADGTTILTAFTLRSYLQATPVAAQRRRPLYVVAEVLDPENARHARAAGADEIIETTRLAFGLVAHAVAMPGAGEIMSQVATLGGLNVYLGRVPFERSMPYEQLVRVLLHDHGVTVFGVRNPNTGEALLPPPSTTPVSPTWQVVYLADAPRLPPA